MTFLLLVLAVLAFVNDHPVLGFFLVILAIYA